MTISALGLQWAHQTSVSPANLWVGLGIPDPANVILLTVLVVAIAVFYSIFIKTVSAAGKKVVFLAIAVPVSAATLYLAGATVYLNLVSATGGPVHWHADYEIWACGAQYMAAHSAGWDNKVGIAFLHTHDDNRIHVEGVLLNQNQASLSSFFSSIGGDFDEDRLVLPTDKGLLTWENGEPCNGKPARWLMFVNGKPIEDGPSHIIAPYTAVPPGDQIKLVFSEKSPTQINPDLGGAP